MFTLHLFKILFIFFITFFFTSTSYAYLDPTTGSVAIYFIVGFLAVIFYSLKDLFYKIRFSSHPSTLKQIDHRNEHIIIFYSEGNNYWNVFSPIIEALDKLSIHCLYLTSDKDDRGLECPLKNVKSKYIGQGLPAMTTLNHLRAKLVVMTTPQLDVIQLRRSKNVQHYAHVVHSPVGMLFYRKFAVDYFDSVLCSGEHQKRDIRCLEEKRGLPKKTLFSTGLTYYDVMVKNLNSFKKNKNDNNINILIAPTWKTTGLLDQSGIDWIKVLLEDGYHVTLRPHPQFFISRNDFIAKIIKELSVFPNLMIDRSPSPEPTMAMADFLISDFSGIIFDFAFLYNKPIIILDNDLPLGGFEGEDVNCEVWEIATRSKLGSIIKPEQISQLSSIIKKISQENKTIDRSKIKEQSVYHFGTAGIVAGEQLSTILKNL